MTEEPDVVVRICADRPFACPVLLQELFELYGAAGEPDYLSNTIEKSYPDGLDLELVRTEALREAARESTDPYEREHVTPFVCRNRDRFRLVNVYCPFGNFADVRAVIDTSADYERLTKVSQRLPDDADYRDIINCATASPELFP
jgi:spore coat polysaccharide biosynthesis protein SpsF